MNSQDLLGKTIYSSDGETLGTTAQVFRNDRTGEPEWVSVTTGPSGASAAFVPVRDLREQDGVLHLPFPAATVRSAPAMAAADGQLSEQQQDQLYRHYETTAGGPIQDVTDGEAAMTRSEERLRLGTERVVIGRARLRKYVTTEMVTTTVPVRKEHVVLETDPITDDDRGDVVGDSGRPHEDYEMILSEERVVVTTEIVPVERVRLRVETETVHEQVSAAVRKENIERVEPPQTTLGGSL